jgi:hypothetical protein
MAPGRPTRATCLAHHPLGQPEQARTIMIAFIRHPGELVKQDGRWLLAGRRLMVDWAETRPTA